MDCKFLGKNRRKKGLGGVWAGFVLLSFATTLPELFTSVSAAAVFKAPDLSIGNLFGSIMFNLLMIALLDIVQGPGPIMRMADSRLILLAGISVGLSSIAALGILTGLSGSFFVSPFSFVLLAGYLLCSRLVYANRPESGGPGGVSAAAGSEGLFWLGYAACAVTILVASIFIVGAVDRIAESTGLGRTFAGTIFLAAATSLPEAAATVTAVRRGFHDMALGNILGANMLNIAIIFFADVFYFGGGILGSVSPEHAATALLGILMTGALIIGIIYRSKKSFGLLGWDSVIIIVSYFAGGYILYSLR